MISRSQTTRSAGSGSEESFQQGLIALRENRLNQAIEAFTAAEEIRPGDARVHNFRGIALMSAGRFDEAAREYLRATELDSRLEDAHRNLGYLEWTAHQNDRARNQFERALELAPDDIFARYYLARLDLEDSREEQAVALFKQLAGQNNSPPWAQYDLAMAYLHARQYENAARLAQTLSQNPQMTPADLGSIYTIIGIADTKLRRDEQARAIFRKAASSAPGQEEHWLNLTRELMESNRFAESIAAAQEGLKSNPKSYALHLRLGAAYISSGEYAEAEKSFRGLVNAGDPLPMSYIGLAQVLLRTGRAAEAASMLADAEQRLEPQFLIVYFEGLALDRAGDRAASLQAFDRAVRINPNNADAHLGAGKTSLALGHFNDAVAELQKVLQLDPGNQPARRLLHLAYARLGDHVNAAKYATAPTDPEPEPAASLVGDFILPDWREPRAQ
ncbi:MAG: tetratricopeptide repeat protein [Bryobacteraceae bacterium]